MRDLNPPDERRFFRTGEAVSFQDGTGVIIAAFPDGFHLIRLDGNGHITGAHVSQLRSRDDVDDLRRSGVRLRNDARDRRRVGTTPAQRSHAHE